MRAILTYHSIDDSGSAVSCTPAAFASHVQWLASGRVRVATVDELLALPDDADAVTVTFDDAYVNFGETAAPRLLDHGLPVTVFVVADLAGRANVWDSASDPASPARPLLGWPALERLQQRGVTIGAHSRTHPDLRLLDGQRLEDEIVGSADAIEARVGHRPTVFAYPYGRTSVASAQLVRRAFRYGCTTEFRAIGEADEPALLPRLDMYYFQRPGSLEHWGRPSFDARIRMRHFARRVRGLVQGRPTRADAGTLAALATGRRTR